MIVKNGGLPTLSQGAITTRKTTMPFAAERTERAVPHLSPRPAIREAV